jgi:nanoRNase/pAp phosphatase (c-di-AMP/oligoRNAs hydrolase)
MTQDIPVAEETQQQEAIHIAKFKAVFQASDEKKIRRVALFTHANPDPDAIGSMMALDWILRKRFNIEAQGFYAGQIAHPQNMSMVNMLDPNIRPIEDYVPDDYDLRILLDTVPTNAGIGKIKVDFDLVIDHHKENCPLDFAGVIINLKAGSCCGTMYEIIRQLNLEFTEGNEIDSTVATAMLVGISTDTENLMSDDTTHFETDAWGTLFPFRSGPRLKQIINFQRPRLWVEKQAEATLRTKIEESYAVVGLGFISGKHRDLIATMAQEIMGWEEVQTAIVYAVVDGDRVEGSVRSVNNSLNVPKLAKELGGKNGCGGGKLGKGAYRYDLGGSSVSDDEGEEIAKKMWEVIDSKETARIMRIIRK